MKKQELEKQASQQIVNMSLRLDSALHERVRKYSFDTKEKMHTFVVQAIEAALKAKKY